MIRGETGLSSALIGLITTLPLLGFAVLSPLAQRVARRWGIERVLLVSLIALIGGIVLRSVPVLSMLFIGTTILGLAIALGNVLLPGLIKRDFPQHTGLMTGIYSMVLAGGGAVAPGVSIPLTQGLGLGWRGSLMFWALPAALAAVVWLVLLLARRSFVIPANAGISLRGLWSSSLAWQVTLFMGLQSLAFYITIAWLPAIFQSDGLSAEAAGWLLSLLQFVSILSCFLVPILAGRMHNQRGIVVVICLLCLVAYGGFLSITSTFTVLWCILLGLGQGACLGLALMFFILRTSDARSAAELSGMAQSIGYLLAALGPLLFGWLHDLTHSWTIPLLTLMAVTIALLAVGLGAGRNSVVESEGERSSATP
jgi:CP family cyanate transporter-like MFS transporter